MNRQPKNRCRACGELIVVLPNANFYTGVDYHTLKLLGYAHIKCPDNKGQVQ